MELVRQSNLYRLWTLLCVLYEGSALHRCLAALGRWCNRQIDTSAVLRVLCREGRWPGGGRRAAPAICWGPC